MKIIGIDVSYQSLGYSIFDLETNRIKSNTITFHSSSALNKVEKKLFKNYNSDEMDKNLRSDLWSSIRLYHFLKEIMNNDYDVVISEKQFSVVSEVFAITRLACIKEIEIHGLKESKIDYELIPFVGYYPNSWRKILFNKGRIEKGSIKQVTSDKVNIFLNNLGINYSFKSQDEIDSFALIMTYIKEKQLIDLEYFKGVEIE